MRKFTLLKSFILATGLLLAFSGWGQTTIFLETIDLNTTPSGTQSIANTNFDNTGLTFSGTGDTRTTNASSGYTGASGGRNVFLTNTGNRTLIISGINTSNFSDINLKFGLKKSTVASNATHLIVEVSEDGVNFSNLSFPAQPTGTGTTNWRLIEITGGIIPSAETLTIRFTNNEGEAQINLDDIHLTGVSVSNDPTLYANPLGLSDFGYVFNNGPSSSQTFQLSGSDLDGTNVTVTAPTNFEISEEENGTYSDLITFIAFDGTASDIWVRLVDELGAGDYSGNISITGGGADAISVAVSGTVVEAFGIPYENDFRTLADKERALLQGFVIENADQETGAGGYLKIFLNGFVETPEIDFTAFDQLKLAFSTATFGTGSDRQLELKISNDGGVSYQSIFTAFPTSATYDDNVVIVDLTGINNVTNGKFKFEMTAGTGQVRFRDLLITEVPTALIVGAADDASNYPGGWTGNEGYGFGDWYFASDNGGYFRAAAGEQGVNSGQIDTDGNSFGMWADGFSDVGRLFGNPLPDGHSFSFTLAYQWDNGNKGFSLYDSDWVTEVFNWNVNDAGYTWNGGSAASTPWENDRQNGVSFEFTFTQNGSDLDFMFSSIAGGGTSGSGTLTNTNADRIKFFVSGAGGGTGANLYFNSLAIELTNPNAIPMIVNLFVKGQVELNNNLEVENLFVEEGQYLQINPNVNLTVNGTLSVDNIGRSLSGLRIKSDNTGTGSLIHQNTGVLASVERYITAAGAWGPGNVAVDWHFISSPVAGQPVSGSWTPSGAAGDYDFYAWDESEEELPWRNQKDAANNITQFNSAQGYLVAYEETDTKEFTGELHAGNIGFTLQHTAPATKTWTYVPGWNLVGNPYASGFNWSMIDHNVGTSLLQDVFAYIYDRNKDGGPGYIVIDGLEANASIPAHQGFFVLAKSGSHGQNLVFSNDMRLHGGSFLKSDNASDQFILRLANETYYDVTTIRIREESSIARDHKDAIKMMSFHPGVPQVYTKTSDGVGVAINSIPGIPETYNIPVSIRVPANGTMTLSLFEANGAFDGENILLEDLKTGITHNLSQYPEYNFIAATDDNPDRFLLKFTMVGVPEIDGGSLLQAYTYSGMLYVINPTQSKALVEVYNVQGQLVLSRETGQGLQSMEAPLAPGAYIVRMIAEEETATRKVIIQ